MKTRNLFVASLLVAAGVAVADTTTIETESVLGVMPVVANGKPEVILSIPWVAEGSITNAVAVTNLVKTAGLTSSNDPDEADTLTWYNTDTGMFMRWMVVSNTTNHVKYWQPIEVDSGEGASVTPPNNTALKQGQALLLTRAASNEVIYVVGQVGTNATITTSIAEATGEGPTYTLVAPPGALGRALDLNTSGDISFTGSISNTVGTVAGDMIVSEAYQGLTTRFFYSGKHNKWVASYDLNAETPRDARIPAGRGFWYMRVGTTPLTITWPAPHTSN